MVARPRLDDPYSVRSSAHLAIVVRLLSLKSRRLRGATDAVSWRPMVETTASRVRFAPSPTGYLHLGSARTGLYNYIFARRHEGTFVLRIEDTDLSAQHGRGHRPDHRVDEGDGPALGRGPRRAGTARPLPADGARRHLPRARRAPARERPPVPLLLHRRRARSRAHGGAGRRPRLGVLGQVPGAERGRGPAPPGGRRTVHAARACARRPHRLPRHPARRRRLRERHHGDFIVQRSDGTVTYNLAVVVDDVTMEITHVIRGDDHISNTPKQVVIYEALGAGCPSSCTCRCSSAPTRRSSASGTAPPSSSSSPPRGSSSRWCATTCASSAPSSTRA